MLNPNMLKIWKQRFNIRSRGLKVYRAAFEMAGYAQFSRRSFKTATGAIAYGERVLARWKRLYEAAVRRMVEQV